LNPTLGAKVGTRIADDLRWLNVQAPVGTSAPLLQPPAAQYAKERRGAPKLKTKQLPFTVPKSEMSKYIRKSEVLGDPLKAIDKLRQGKLAPETSGVMRARRPALLAAITANIVNEVAQLALDGKVAPRAQRIQATLLTGVNMDPTMQPEFIRMAQSIWESRRQAGGGEGGGGAPPPPRRATSTATRGRLRDLRTSAQMVQEELS
jgi:hypothetical protein